MAPLTTSTSDALFEDEKLYYEEKVLDETGPIESERKYRIKLVLKTTIIIAYLHIAAVYGLYLVFTSAKVTTILFAAFLYQFSEVGVTAGSHRLWSHRAFKAKWPLRLLLIIMQTTAYQSSAFRWARDHRVHHKYGDTNADPYNAKRGFFFAHVGWLLCRKHPDVVDKGQKIDISDLYEDSILQFQHNNFIPLVILCCFVIPTVIPVYFWNESWRNAYYVAVALRWVFTVNSTWLINSLAHFYGNRPYDKNITPVENLTVAILASGEGWHNYHHTFPWDYKAAELGGYRFNFTTAFIDLMALMGWAYDLKTTSLDLVKRRAKRTGDGSHELWGWDDQDMTKEDRDDTIIT